MKVLVTEDDGTVLDSTDVTAEDWRDEMRLHPHGILAQLAIGETDDDDDSGCEGHESLAGEHMGETVYCDGTCR